MEIIDHHRRATAAAAHRPSPGCGPSTSALPTPCAGWDLRALLEHMTGQDHGFAAAVRAGSTADVDVGAFAPLPLGPDPARTSAAAADDLVAAFAEAAADPGRSVWLPEFGRRFTLEQVAGFHLIDTLVHGWDVAVTLGIALDYDDDLVAAGLEQAEQVPDGALREQPGSPFARALADAGGSDPWERTLALLGRDPTWSPYRASGAVSRSAPSDSASCTQLRHGGVSRTLLGDQPSPRTARRSFGRRSPSTRSAPRPVGR